MTAGVFKSDLVTNLARTRPLVFYVAGRKAGGVADMMATFEITKSPDDGAIEASA